MKKIRILLIEDNRLLREGLTAMLQEQPDITVEPSSGNSDAVLKGKKLKPDVVLLDLGLRSQSSMRVLKLIKKSTPDARVIVMDLARKEYVYSHQLTQSLFSRIVKQAMRKRNRRKAQQS